MKFNITFYCVLLTCFAGRIIAELPVIDRSDLVSLVQTHENKIQSYQVKYLLQYGELTSENKFKADVNIECEYAYDMGKELHYLHQKWLEHSSGDEMESKYAFDGKTGMVLNLKVPGTPNEMHGAIINKKPQEIAAQNAGRPLWNSCGYFSRYNSNTLSDAIKMGKNVKIDAADDHTYKVSFSLTGEKASTKNPRTGKTIHYTKDGHFIVWLSEQYGFMPVNIAKFNGPVDHGGKIKEHTELSDFREIEDGVWLPHKIEMRTMVGQRGSSMAIKDVVINENAKVVSKLQFPPKTYVKDEVLGIEYQVGLSDSFIDSEIDQAVETVARIKNSDNLNGGLSEKPEKESLGHEIDIDEQINSNQKGNQTGSVVSTVWLYIWGITGLCVLAGMLMLLIRKNNRCS